MTPWSRLQALSCAHNAKIGPQGGHWLHRTGRFVQRSVPFDIEENVKILARGDDAELKDRVHWYITFHPDIFEMVSRGGWK